MHCIDPSEAITVAKKLKKFKNIKYHQRSLDSSGIKNKSQDFGYLLGVIHYVPNAKAAIKSCAKLLKPGALILFYIYYSLDNRPLWFKYLWNLSNLFRILISRLPKFLIFYYVILLLFCLSTISKNIVYF